MNRRPSIFAVVLFSLSILIGLTEWLFLRPPQPKVAPRDGPASAAVAASTSRPPGAVQGATADSPAAEAVPPATPLSPKDRATVRAALKQFFSHFESMGGGESGPPFAYVAREVADRNKVKIDRAFTELVYRYSPSDSIPVLKSYVNDRDAYTRYVAAESLLIAGDDSGVPALTTILKSEHPIEGLDKGDDIRIAAALVLAKYHQTAAIADILGVYSETEDGQLSEALANLGVPLPNENALHFVPSSLALTEYAQRGTTRFLPQIKALFEHTNKPDLKVAAAWSLATMTGDAAATNFVVDKARSGLDKANTEDARDERKTIMYVGTLRTPEAKQTLEAALEKSDAVVVQRAIVNLLYYQGGSELAIQKLADQYNDTTHATLPWDFVYQITAKFLDNPVLRTAGLRFAQPNNEMDWRRDVLERRNWPIDNWVGEYVIQVKR